MKGGSIRSFLLGILVSVLLFSLAGTALAAQGRQSMNVDYADIKVVLNGEEIDLTDANGAAVEPFSYNGTVYLPVRAVSRALGVTVWWNDTNKAVNLFDLSALDSTEYY